MNRLQAWNEANRRWGMRALAYKHRDRFTVAADDLRRLPWNGNWGEGDSWENAFADADQRSKERDIPSSANRPTSRDSQAGERERG